MRKDIDLHDFIPPGIDTSSIPAAALDLPVSAAITAQADIRRAGTSTHAGRAFAPGLWGHHEDGEAVLYRVGARDAQYFHGDLMAWRTNGYQYRGPNIYEGRIEARLVPGGTP